MPLILFAVASVFLLHQKGNFAIDILAIGCNIEPKLGVPLLLVVLFYSHICSSSEESNDFHDMLVSVSRYYPDPKLMHHMLPAWFLSFCMFIWMKL